MKDKITPSFIMNQIRNGVRETSTNSEIVRYESAESTISEITSDQEVNQILNKIQTTLKKLKHKITPNMPVAFLEPHLTSRYKILGKVIVPIRKFGARLFTKWYADSFSHQQRHFNKILWNSLNDVLEVINEQNTLILKLTKQNEEYLSRIDKLTKCNDEFLSLKERFENIDDYQKELNTNFLEIDGKINKGNILEFNYSKFAERFSAKSEDVKRIYFQYIKYFKDSSHVLDVGCGKGYFLELLQENNIPGMGIDSDAELVLICNKKGLKAYTAEAVSYVEKLDDNSMDGIFMGHVIEHLPTSLKIKLLKLIYRKLKDKGTFIIETPNTTSPYVMHNLYYLDPTHEKPMFPEALKHIAIETGFVVVDSYLSSPIEQTNSTEYYNHSLILSK
jgi:2-polyprenyl-3-methyl-5-hydroxy-6-metoxy-1,4-benzoquinol methylase